jgi:hypothetical protein
LVFEVKLQSFSNIHAVTIYGNHVCQNDAWKKNIARKFEEKKYTISERVSHWLGGTNPMLIPLHGSAKINVPWT